MGSLHAEDDSRISACKSCGAEIVWMKTKNDKNICVDLPPVEDPLRDEVMEATLFDRERFTTHFETCPNASQHRRARGGAPTDAGETPTDSAKTLARKLNVALKTLEDIAKNAPDGLRSVQIAKAGVEAVHKTS